MKKALIAAGLVALFSVVGILIAETDYQVGQGVEKVVTRKLEVKGRNAAAQINGTLSVTGTVSVSGNITAGGDMTVDDLTVGDDAAVGGDLQVTGAAVVYGDVTADQFNGNAEGLTYVVVTAANVTNGQAVTLIAGRINMLNGVGGAADTTNTITIANFAADDVGKITYLANAYAATNIVRIAKTGNFYGDTIELGAGDSMAIYAGTTNVLYGK
jgi:hypothetical protein